MRRRDMAHVTIRNGQRLICASGAAIKISWRLADGTCECPLSPHTMVEEPHVTKRYLSSLKNVYQYVKSHVGGFHNSDSSTSKTADSPPKQSSKCQDTQGVKVIRTAGPIEQVHLFPAWAVRRYVDGGGWTSPYALGRLLPALN